MELAANQTAATRVCEVKRLGHVPYAEGLALQARAVEQVKEQTGNEQLFLLEHNHVFTLGRAAKAANILLSADQLEAARIEVYETGRGGDVTYHGPGQLVGYPILNLKPDRQDVHRYVRDLEEVLIRTIADFGIIGSRITGLTGVWVGDEKIAAIGVRISRWVTSHGFALNVTPDLAYFRMIVPCGITEKGVTSMTNLLKKSVDLSAVTESLIAHFYQVFQRKLHKPSPE